MCEARRASLNNWVTKQNSRNAAEYSIALVEIENNPPSHEYNLKTYVCSDYLLVPVILRSANPKVLQ